MVKHILRRDFFNAAVNARFHYILAALVSVYVLSLTAWATTYYIIWRMDEECFIGLQDFNTALLFAIETQNTIGYGVRAPGDCWLSSLTVAMHSLVNLVLNSIVLGIAFSRISHPKNRGRTILLSDCAVIARRDGQLKFMFRLADLKRKGVVGPEVTAFLFTYGEGRTTAEGEHMPVRVHELVIDPWDKTLLLPVIVEHTIDERSPLYGHNKHSLEALRAEVVVKFEGSTELGDSFMVRTSYLPQEMHWGHVFERIVKPAPEGETQHLVDISRFHDVCPQPAIEMLLPHRVPDMVLNGPNRALPGPVLAENTLAVSEEGVICRKGGRLYLMFRVADTYPPGQVVNVTAKAHIYRWKLGAGSEHEADFYDVAELALTPTTLFLKYPMIVMHEICEGSAISGWTSEEGKRMDSAAEVVLTVTGVLYSTNHVVTRTRTYPVLGAIKWAHAFAPMVVPNTSSKKKKQGGSNVMVDWAAFNLIIPSSADRVVVRPTRTSSDGTQPMASSGSTLVAPHTSVVGPVPSVSAATAAAMHRVDSSARLAGALHRVDSSSRLSNLLTARSAAQDELDRAVHSHHTTQSSYSRPSPEVSFSRNQPPGSMRTASHAAHFDTVGGQSWKETRSLFAALEELKKMSSEEVAQLQGQDKPPHKQDSG